MKRVRFETPYGSVQFNGKAPAALGALQLLESAGPAGLEVPDIEAKLADGAGILMNGVCSEQDVSVLMQRLINCGAVEHPPGHRGNRKYAVRCWPNIIRC